jgi:hypothetical protein
LPPLELVPPLLLLGSSTPLELSAHAHVRSATAANQPP